MQFKYPATIEMSQSSGPGARDVTRATRRKRAKAAAQAPSRGGAGQRWKAGGKTPAPGGRRGLALR